MQKATIREHGQIRIKSTDSDQYLTLKEFSAYFGWHEITTRRRIADGTITAKRFGPRLIRIHISELEKFGVALGAFGGN
jgi:excisionase family DNA binding protein